jgi:hypothetical protein
VLFWNEGRTGLFPVAQSTSEIASDVLSTDASLNNAGVSTSGKLTSDSLLGDDLYVKPGKYAAVGRTVEMYSWIEDSNSQSSSNVGGSETNTTTYTYKKDWKENVEKSANFNNPTGHVNPAKTLESKTFTIATAKVGVYEVNIKEVDLPAFEDLALNTDNFLATASSLGQPSLVGGSYVYLTTAAAGTSYTNPQVGDMRVSYAVVNLNSDVTVFGKLQSGSIKSFSSADGQKLFRMFTGSREAALNQIKTEDTIMTWVLRGVGFFMMWIGLSSLFGPITTLADIIPILGSLSKSVVSGITFVIAFILTVITIVVSMILHNIIALIIIGVIILVVVVGAGYVLLHSKKKTAGSKS